MDGGIVGLHPFSQDASARIMPRCLAAQLNGLWVQRSCCYLLHRFFIPGQNTSNGQYYEFKKGSIFFCV